MTGRARSAGRQAALAVIAALFLGVVVIRYAPRLIEPLVSGLSPALAEAVVQGALFGALIAIASLMGVIQRQPVWRHGRRPLALAPAGLAIGVGGLSLALLFPALAGDVVAGPPRTASIEPLAIGVAATLLQATGEEAYLRGWLQPVLQRALGNGVGMMAAAVLFALLHLVLVARMPLSLLNILLAGIFFGLLAWRSGGLAAPVAAHFGWNCAEQLGLGLDPNPGIGPFGAIADLDLVGPALWGGSSEGLNGSIGVTFVLGIFILPLALWRGRRDRARDNMRTIIALPLRPAARHIWLLGDRRGSPPITPD